jgi:hypothetical protein
MAACHSFVPAAFGTAETVYASAAPKCSSQT